MQGISSKNYMDMDHGAYSVFIQAFEDAVLWSEYIPRIDTFSITRMNLESERTAVRVTMSYVMERGFSTLRSIQFPESVEERRRLESWNLISPTVP